MDKAARRRRTETNPERGGEGKTAPLLEAEIEQPS